MASEEFTLPQLHLPSRSESPKPKDSVDNIGTKISARTKLSSGSSTQSRSSSVSAAKAKAATRRAVLQAEVANLESFQSIQEEE